MSGLNNFVRVAWGKFLITFYKRKNVIFLEVYQFGSRYSDHNYCWVTKNLDYIKS